MEDLDEKVAIVTGGSSGIGRAICRKLAAEGAKVVVSDIRKEPREGGKPTDEIIQDHGGEASFIEADVSIEEEVIELVEETLDIYGQIDILVNNAGVHHFSPVAEEDEDGWDEIMDVNLKGTFLCSKHVIDHMLEEGIEGNIINIASMAGLVGYKDSAAYCSSKGGVVNLTREMALEYGPEQINVNAVCPGVTKTAMTADTRSNEKRREEIERNTPARRLGEPEDIANATAFLASELSEFIIGECLVVDGGWTSR